MMTELERARAHLRQAQSGLAFYRRCQGEGIRNIEKWIADNEACVLAALSWVWQEQEREKASDLVNDYGIPWVREALWMREAETYECAIPPHSLLTELALVLDDTGSRNACRAVEKAFPHALA